MDSSSILKPVYEDFDVHTEWVHEISEDTLIVYLPGFNKEQLKVQVSTGGKLKISGERPIGGNKISRFFKEFPIPSNCDQNKIRANFRGGMLYIKHPKLIVPADEIQQEQAKPSADIPKSDQKLASDDPQPQKPVDVPQKQSDNGLKQAVQEAPPKVATMEEKTGDEESTERVAKETEDVSEKIPDKEMEMKGKSNAAAINEHDKPMEKEEKSWDQEENTCSYCEKREKLGESLQEAAKKEEVDTEKLDGAIDKYQPAGIDINMVWLKYKQMLDDLAMGVKNSRKMMNMVLAVLLVAVLAVYLRNAIRSLRNQE